ncbi:MAG: hypothetical protein IJK52_06690 [Oscillospiraceae bacterium]|nr:hypothetical protein [Oscillospiraceae bacterium]
MRRGGAVSGAVSLVVIFGVLCMAVFAALTFATANRERGFAELDALRAEEFYQADTAATKIAAALRAGERELAESLLKEWEVSSEILFTEQEDGTLADFSIPAGGQQRLEARLILTDGEMDILRWRKSYAGTWENDDSITLADIAE